MHYTPDCPAWGVLTVCILQVPRYSPHHTGQITGPSHSMYIHTGSTLIYIMGRIQVYRKSGNFRCKSTFVVDHSYMHTINVNVVRGRSYENFSTQKFIIQKFPDLQYFAFSCVYRSDRRGTPTQRGSFHDTIIHTLCIMTRDVRTYILLHVVIT